MYSKNGKQSSKSTQARKTESPGFSFGPVKFQRLAVRQAFDNLVACNNNKVTSTAGMHSKLENEYRYLQSSKKKFWSVNIGKVPHSSKLSKKNTHYFLMLRKHGFVGL